MSRNHLIITLAAGVVLFQGCYGLRQVSAEEFLDTPPSQETFIYTNEPAVYHVGKSGCREQGDSLLINGFRVTPSGREMPVRRTIAKDEVTRADISEFKTAHTVALVVFTATAIYGLSNLSLPKFGIWNGRGLKF